MVKVKKMQMMSCYQMTYQSPLGTLFLLVTDRGLRNVFWRPQSLPHREFDAFNQSIRLAFTRVTDQLNDYFSGQLRQFDLELDIEGTPFQKKVWQSVASIPYGDTLSYAEVAMNIGMPGATRAVGTALKKNPLCVVIPCHRVISARGGFGGYSGGLAAKQFLLSLERTTR